MDTRFEGARVVVTGAAGFVGSHLSHRLLDLGARVVGIDNLATGTQENFDRLAARSGFTARLQDVTTHLDVQGPLTHVLHLASAASPPAYLAMPLETLEVGSIGTRNALELARATSATFLLASTSEVYGDPQVHPQSEDYWGHVNPVGPRSVYDEAKRFGEAMTTAYHHVHGVDVRIPRIFNTYGEGMRHDDGRAVPNFIDQALAGRPITVHGDGRQTRSLMHVDDLVGGLLDLLTSDLRKPCNLGNPVEVSMRDLARLVRDLCGSDSPIEFGPARREDPAVRCPDISLAQATFGFRPTVGLERGLERTIEHAIATHELATA